MARLATANTGKLDRLPDIVPTAVDRYRFQVEQMEKLSDQLNPRRVARAHSTLKELLGEIRLEPHEEGYLIAHLELQNQALALVATERVIGGSGGLLW